VKIGLVDDEKIDGTEIVKKLKKERKKEETQAEHKPTFGCAASRAR